MFGAVSLERDATVCWLAKVAEALDVGCLSPARRLGRMYGERFGSDWALMSGVPIVVIARFTFVTRIDKSPPRRCVSTLRSGAASGPDAQRSDAPTAR